MKRYLVRRSAAFLMAVAAMGLSASSALAQLDYSSSLAAEFKATFPGGDPGAGAPSSATFGDWALRGPDGTPGSLAAFAAGLPASGQPGWDADPSQGAPYTYFATQWQPGVTIDPRVEGHAPQDVLWTAPASVNEGGVSLTGSIEQIFEEARVQRISVFKNGSAAAAFFVDSVPPTVNGVLLNRVDFGPVTLAVSPGDTLRFLVDGSGEGGTGVPTFVAWDVTLSEVEAVIPEPATAGLLSASLVALAGYRRRN